MHYDGIGNGLELQLFFKTMIIVHCDGFERLGTTDKIKTISKACIVTVLVFENIWNCRKLLENSVSKACILTVLGTIWNCRENLENDVSTAYILRPDGS